MMNWDQFRDDIQNHWYGHWPLRKQAGRSTRAGSRREGEKLSIFNTFPEWLVCIYMDYESSCWHLTTTLQGSSETNLKFIYKRIAYSYLYPVAFQKSECLWYNNYQIFIIILIKHFLILKNYEYGFHNLFTSQIFTKYLLCARYIWRPQKYINKQNR